ncbi:hypothetical protein FS837_002699 [Tulasnella sp. UAMH 9824]|nr:hypothetical protein FS837_002699 [Tulasnella sp. UAMH 9824]
MSSGVTTIPVLDASELQDGQMKQVDFGKDGKVLLSKVRGRVQATSAFCTHYGAPLIKGTLESSGRVVCPWHGACFNVCTGDIEDAPALDAIHSFPCEVRDGKIYVTAREESTLKSNMARQPAVASLVLDSPDQDAVVIVGGGAATIHAIESLRLHGFGGSITVLTKEGYAPIDRTRLSKSLGMDLSKLQWRTPQELKERYNVDYRTNVEVTAVDTVNKTVTIGGTEQVNYTKLILATGATPRKLGVEGENLNGVYSLRQYQDAEKISAGGSPLRFELEMEAPTQSVNPWTWLPDLGLQKGKKLVVIGSSFISMELVAAAQKKELAEMHVVGSGSSKLPFAAILGDQIAQALYNFHQKNGVQFHMSSGLQSIKASAADPSSVGSVVLKDGTEIPADVVVLGVGVRPATEFLKGSKLESAMQRDGGLKVDGQLRVDGFEDVFALGDIAVYPQAQDGVYKRIEHWNVASNHGRAVGETIGKRKDKLAAGFKKVPIFWSGQGMNLRYCGIGEGWDDVIIKGNLDELKFAAYYCKEGKVIAAASMNSDPIVTRAAELLRLGIMPSPEEIRGGKDLYTIDIASRPIETAPGV